MQKAQVLGGVAAILGATVLATLVVRAQQSEERAARFPIKQHPHDIESTFIQMPLPAGHEQYASLEGTRLKRFVHEVAAISRQSRDAGDLLWGRVAGSHYDDLAEGLVEKHFKAWGLEGVRRQYFDLAPQWFAVSAAVRVSGSGKTLSFPSIVPGRGSTSTPAAGLDLDLVWVGAGSEGDFAGRDVRGKLAVIESFPMPSVVGHSAEYNGALQRAVERGAAAVLVNIGIPGNLKTAMGAARDANRRLPTFSIGTEDLASLLALMGHGPVKAHVQLTAEMRSGLKDANVWGTLPGTSDEDIIILAHHDGFFEGALDNASGTAVMLGLAEYYSKMPREKRRRTLKFVSTSGHHGDGITPGSLGTRWLHDNRETVLARTALVMNAEHVSAVQVHWDRLGPGSRWSNNISARRWWVNGSDKLASLALDAYQTFGVTIYETMDHTTTGDMSHVDRDAPSIQLIESALYYHTDQDRPEYVPAQGLEAVARAYAKIIDQTNRVDRADLLPAPLPTTSRQAGR